MTKTLSNITIEEVNEAAEKNASEYDIHCQKAARAAFIEGFIYAQKIYQESGRTPVC